MECVEALKTSVRREMAARPFVWDETAWPAAAANNNCSLNVSSSDDFLVDELLDFSNDDGLVQAHEQEEEGEERTPKVEEEGEGGGGGGGAAKLVSSASCSAEERFSAKREDFGPLPASELSVPDDDLADLEWLSHFVDDSFSKFSSPFPTVLPAEKPRNPQNHQSRSGTEAPSAGKPHFATTPAPAKSRRSKRARTGGRVWSLGSPSLTDASSSSCSSSSSSNSPAASNWLVRSSEQLENVIYSERKPPAKKQKRPDQAAPGPAQPTRRCSHCGVQKTPQWRAGPLGAKTLCNACGVRFKSGRLFPEYRPACSPTFSSEVHSNHHRKVLEMRRKKEVLGQTGSAQAVPSF
ncbi:hypothetical protein BT93_I0679 [Corymbia citriodora subsp. variegata]|nr:hypothetical protein BT93_I0679 [Corymbia citriodora subsp. variegata]